ncbi:UvrD-helicase domain-containing protein [Promicromonospora sp. NPDC050880]|uniref:UvrD-helicase domain-containing protein n=1 Tax=Promicromonospora sp. NPDC050880 TaxID=3364406 RepID=UPI0037B0D262
MIRSSDWVPTGGKVLERNALAAATAVDQNVVVTAGPGSGKTELLAQRADFLFRTGACPYPRRILAVSFKVDAARNLRERVRQRSGTRYAARFDSFTFHAFAKRIIDNYRPALAGISALDADYSIDPDTRVARTQITFKDLVPLALEILETNRYARGGIRQTYSHVFLDEFQDATTEQYDLLKAAFTHGDATMTAVGDVKQRIMAWAGALDGVLQTFADDFSATPLSLYQNFRSAPRLRRMQNRMITVMDATAASDAESLAGDAGTIDVCGFETDRHEAEHVADQVQTWLADGIAPSEIAILVRQQPHLVTARLAESLSRRGIAFRNEQDAQDLVAEPAATLVFNYIRVVTSARQPAAYTELMRTTARADASEEEALRFDRKLKRLIQEARTDLRTSRDGGADPTFWRSSIASFLELVSRPALMALSPGYQQGSRLDDVLDQAFKAFEDALTVEEKPAAAIKRLSDTETVRILTIHKCKGLEFERVVVLGVENELFWGDPEEAISAFFVAISRAKTHLTLTHARFRDRPVGHTGRWRTQRTARADFLAFSTDT